MSFNFKTLTHLALSNSRISICGAYWCSYVYITMATVNQTLKPPIDCGIYYMD